MFELTTIVRQKNADFANFLNRLRVNEPADGDVDRVNSRVGASVPPGTIRACRRNADVNAFNEQCLAGVHVEVAEAEDRPFSNQLSDKVRSELLKKAKEIDKYNDSGNMPTILKLAIDQNYMVTYNFMREDGLLNGTMGKLKHFCVNSDTKKIEIILEKH